MAHHVVGNVVFGKVGVNGEVGTWGVNELEGSWVVQGTFDADRLSLNIHFSFCISYPL